MEFLIVPIETLKEIDSDWEYRRKSNDGTKAIIHKEIYDKIMPQVNTLALEYDEEGNPINSEPSYPFPLVNGDEINSMEEFKSKEEDIKPIK